LLSELFEEKFEAPSFFGEASLVVSKSSSPSTLFFFLASQNPFP